MDILLEKVKSNLKKLSIAEKSILVALSGGKDSISLLHSLLLLKKEFSLTISVAYVNHNLRGKESAEEEKFITKIIERLNLPLYKLIIRKECWDEVKNESIEMIARRLRYNFFKKVITENNIDYLATAHNFNDKIETFFLQLSRGSGVDALKSIPFKYKNIVRPLLTVTRKEIDEFIKKYNLPFVEDSSNKENVYKRNIIRNKILPLFRDIHNNFEKSFIHVFNFLEEEQKLLDYLSKKNFKRIFLFESPGKICIHKNKFMKLPKVIKKQIIKLILKKMNYPVKPSFYMLDYLSSQRERIKYKKSDFFCSSNNDYMIFIDIKSLITLDESLIVDAVPFEFKNDKLKILINKKKIDDPKKLLCFRDDINIFPLTIRHIKPNDFIYISCDVKKEIRKILKDLKTPVPLYREVIVIQSADNNIIGFYLNNYFRVSHKYYIDNENENIYFQIAYKR
jgi:tRNA(Ile)-lysidine synthase